MAETKKPYVNSRPYIGELLNSEYLSYLALDQVAIVLVPSRESTELELVNEI